MLNLIRKHLSELTTKIQREYRITLLVAAFYVLLVYLLLIFSHNINSIPSGIAALIGVMIICVPTVDLDIGLIQAKKLREFLTKLSPIELDRFQKIVMRREFEAVLEDGGVFPGKPPDPNASLLLSDLMADIAKDETLRSYITPPLMQESRVSRLNYLRRVWPKDGPKLKTAM